MLFALSVFEQPCLESRFSIKGTPTYQNYVKKCEISIINLRFLFKKKKIKMVGGGKKIMANFYIPKYHV